MGCRVQERSELSSVAAELYLDEGFLASATSCGCSLFAFLHHLSNESSNKLFSVHFA